MFMCICIVVKHAENKIKHLEFYNPHLINVNLVQNSGIPYIFVYVKVKVILPK